MFVFLLCCFSLLFFLLRVVVVVLAVVVVDVAEVKSRDLAFRLNTITFSDDSNLICGGFENSSLRIWTLTPRKLRALKPATELARIDAGTNTREVRRVAPTDARGGIVECYSKDFDSIF